MNIFGNWMLDLQIGFFVLSIMLAYLYWIRPALRERPGYKEFYSQTESCIAAIKLKFQGIKGKIATGLAKAVALIVLIHDSALPYVTGVDWTPIITRVPNWAWPLIAFSFAWFIGKAREWAEQRE